MSLPNDLSEEEFLHWVKATLGLQIAKRGSSNYIKTIMTKFIHELKKIHPPDKEDHFDSLLYKVMFRGEIKLGKIRGVRSWMLYDQSCMECKDVISRMLDAFNEIKDCTAWTRHCEEESFKPDLHWWIVSKIYISKKCEVANASGPEESDPFAVFSLMRNCKQFEEQVKHHAGCLIRLRHELMHSSNNTLTKTKMEEYFSVIKDYLDVIRKSNSDTSQEVVTYLDKALEELDDLENKKLGIFDKDNNLHDFTKKAIATLQQCLRTDFEILSYSELDIITKLIIRIERVKCEKEKQKLRDELKHYEEESKREFHWMKQYSEKERSETHKQLTTKSFTDASIIKEIDITVDTDDKLGVITDTCQMADGTILVSDYSNRRLKRLDDKFNVKDFYDCKIEPLHVVAISSSEVAVLIDPNVLQFISIDDSDKMRLKKEVLVEECHYDTLGMVYCNNHIWIMNVFNGINIYRLSGELQRCLKRDSRGRKYPLELDFPFCNTMSTNIDNTRVYVINDNIVETFDKDGRVVFVFPIEAGKYSCITITDKNLLFLWKYKCSSIDMYNISGRKVGEISEYRLPYSVSILFERKKKCLIVSHWTIGYLTIMQLK